jgi:hypothetical protein
VKIFGQVRGIPRLSSGTWSGDEVDAWEVTQVAAVLLEAEAVYRAPMDDTYMFLLLGSFRQGTPAQCERIRRGLPPKESVTS